MGYTSILSTQHCDGWDKGVKKAVLKLKSDFNEGIFYIIAEHNLATTRQSVNIRKYECRSNTLILIYFLIHCHIEKHINENTFHLHNSF